MIIMSVDCAFDTNDLKKWEKDLDKFIQNWMETGGKNISFQRAQERYVKELEKKGKFSLIPCILRRNSATIYTKFNE